MKKIRLNYLIDVGLFIQFVLVGYSGLVMYFNEHGAGYFLRLIHDKVGILMLIFFVVHIALHRKWIVTTTKNFFVRKRKIKKSSKIKVALAHPAASNGVCSRHRSKFRQRK